MTKDEKLISAVKLVNEAIMAETRRLEKIASGNEQDPILIEGETEANYYCQLMVDPSVVAKIMLRYNYPTCRVLEQDASDDMWEELGREFGLKTVCLVDL
ncbi:hypothetical protein IJ076_03625 [Candidatus Saccharibacteria bacterium]|nr:hypothetical protein [Candidatus Saccharibacteria bacterium]